MLDEDGLAAGQYAMVLLFGSCMAMYAVMETSRLRVLFTENLDLGQKGSASKHSEPLSLTFPSLLAFFKDMSFLGLILLLAFMCENYPIHPQGGKTWDRDMYWFLCLLLLLWSIGTMKKGKSTDILNRDQTEEWKGWMQFMFLMYHYYHAEEVYNAIRIMITCYVWMTGFGNFSFFYIKQDFGIVRMLQMLWRLNFLVTLLCMSQANTYILYYICPLHTFYFFVVYATMRVLPQCNHGKWDVRFKILAAGVIIYLVWDCFNGRLFSAMFSLLLRTQPTIGATSGPLWEWYFRTSLDHYSTLFGMVFALNFPLATRLLNRTEDLPLGRQVLVKGFVGAILGGAFCWWTSSVFLLPKVEYNLTNAYYGWIPLLAYIYFRNLSPAMRSWYSGGLHEIGKVTLETYLMQHHIWLTSNAKTLLVLLPGYPKINMLLCTLLFLFVSKQLYHITMSLRGMILPDDRRRCLVGAATTLGILLFSYILGSIIKAASLGVTGAILMSLSVTACLLGYLHRRVNVWGTGPSAGGSHHPASTGFPSESTKSVALAATLVTLFVVLMAMPFHGASSASSGTPSPNGPTALTAGSPGSPSKCLELVNKGGWTQKDCVADGSGKALCDTESWEWAPEASPCHFHHLGTAELQSLLTGRRVAVVGDSVTRQVYWSLLSSVGYPSPDAHNGTLEKHKDLHFEEPKSGAWQASFYWRPYAEDVQAQLAQWLQPAASSEAPPPPPKPDVLVVGVGLWDALHHKDVQDFEARLTALREDLGRLGEAVKFKAWLVPTTVVDERLTSQEKVEHMTEQHIQAYRAAIKRADVAAKVDVVVEGAALTAAVSRRSHDGVHYDDDTYAVLTQVLGNALSLFSQKGGAARALSAAAGEERQHSARHHVERVLKGGPREVDGTMSSIGHGAFVLLIVFLMLFTMDSYAGAYKVGVRVFSDLRVTWEEAYEPLLSRIHRPQPSAVLPGRGASVVVGGGSSSAGRYTPVPQQDIELSESGDPEDGSSSRSSDN